ncbi:uncharacterized protein J3R85_019692 [Psidium guajava]|nr:uncharacterized protein J3R85_019692 [Psidium guajava]
MRNRETRGQALLDRKLMFLLGYKFNMLVPDVLFSIQFDSGNINAA